MFILKSLKARVQKYIEQSVKSAVDGRLREMQPIFSQLAEFHRSRKEERQGAHDHTKDPFLYRELYAGLADRLRESGVQVRDVDIDLQAFESWMNDFEEIRSFYSGMGDIQTEKCLEHYLSYSQLGLTNSDCFLDIAAEGSPFADLLIARGIQSYRLDIAYERGLHGNQIGADACDTGLPDSFASVLASHCAFECFNGDSDIRFLAEAGRILGKKGRLGILPLYLEDDYFVATSPYCNQNDIAIEESAKRVWRDDEFQSPFARFYSPEAFAQRVLPNIPAGMNIEVLYFRNLPDIMAHYPGQRLYCYFMLVCRKR